MRTWFICLLLGVLIVGIGPKSIMAQTVAEKNDKEIRVQEISETLRCVVCKNQSIADSDADLAKNLVALVEERVEAGDSDEEVRAYIVDRYGEFVLLKPTWSWQNAGLWVSPFLLFLLASVSAWMFIKSKPKGALKPSTSLSADERKELDQLLGETKDRS